MNHDVGPSAPLVPSGAVEQLERQRMGYQRTAFMFESTGSKQMFQRFLGEMAAAAEEQPVFVLEVRLCHTWGHERHGVKMKTKTKLKSCRVRRLQDLR